MDLQWLVIIIQRGRVAEIAIENGNDRLIRKRETFKI